MKNALIVGIDSVIGQALEKELFASGWTVFGTTRRQSQVSKRVFYLDLAHISEINFEIPMDVVFLCAGITKVSMQPSDYAESVNVQAPLALAEHFLNLSTHIIFLSTIAVFDGKKPAYQITDKPCPISFYGEYKATVERELLNKSGLITIVRLTKVLTENYPLFMQWLNELKNGAPIQPFYDLRLCPISIKTVTQCLNNIAETRLPGILHLSGKKEVTYQDVGHYFADKLGVSKDLVQPCSALDAGVLSAEAPLYTSLDISESKHLLDQYDLTLEVTLNDLYNRFWQTGISNENISI